jgi:hypothetical protein
VSIKRITAVWDLSIHSGTALLLMLALADNADDNGLAWPGISTLAQRTRTGERAVKTQLKKLETSGELHTYRRRGQHNFYFVRVGISAEQEAAAVERLATMLKTSVETITSQFRSPVIMRSLGSDHTITGTSDPTITRSAIRTVSETSGIDAAQKAPRKRTQAQLNLDAMKNALADAFGFDHDKVTSSKWNEFGKAGKDLLEAGATPDDMKPLHQWCTQQNWGTFSSAAMAKHWPTFEKARKSSGKTRATTDPSPSYLLERAMYGEAS